MIVGIDSNENMQEGASTLVYQKMCTLRKKKNIYVSKQKLRALYS